MAVINGTSASETVYGTSGNDTIHAGAGNDTIYNDSGNDLVYGDDGDDLFVAGSFGSSIDTYDGGTGNDTLSFEWGHVNISLAITGPQDTGIDGTITVLNIENLIGTTGNDILIGDDNANTINGGGGSDVIRGGGGNDDLSGHGTDNDIFSGGKGDDTIHLDGFGNDIIEFRPGDGHDDVYCPDITMGQVQIYNYSAPQSLTTNGDTVVLTLSDSDSITFHGTTLEAVQNNLRFQTVSDGTITGSSLADKIHGDDDNNVIYGLGGNDDIEGGAGNDTLYGGDGDDGVSGGAGNDILDGGPGSDVFNGGDGIDTVTYADASAGVHVWLGAYSYQDTGGAGTDLFADFIENLVGSPYADDLTGHDGDNVITGGAGADVLAGGGGNDTFLDTAAALNGDTITDFGPGDRIVISDATLANFHFSVSGQTVTYSGGTVTLGDHVAGTLVASAAAEGGVQLTIKPDAQLVSYAQFNLNSIDLNWYYAYTTAVGLQKNSNDTFDGHVYADAFEVQANDGTSFRELDFFGSGITQDASGNIVSGTVNAVGEFDFYSGTFLWYVDDISTSAVSLYRAAQTASNSDEIALVQAALGGNNSIILSPYDDQISGYAGDDTITGGLGADTLTGGTGSDTFKDTVAGHDGDTITDLKAGDAIVFSDASLASFSFSLDGNTLNYSGGSLTLASKPVGHFVATANAGGGVELTLSPEPAHNDFSGDTRSDFLLLDSNSGWLTDWLGQADGSLTSNGANASIQYSSDWHVVGTGDVNGDGNVDYILKSDAGWTTDWLGTSSGGFTNNGANASILFASNWQVAGTGDFNGDGHTDFLLRDTTGGWLTEWIGNANGGFTNNGANSTEYFSSDWKVIGTGDFNGDGTDDFLLQNTAGWVTDWLGTSTGGFTNNGANASLYFTSDWHVIGTGDFNGDGISDILLRSDAGWVTDWLGNSSGGFTNNGANASILFSSDWKIASIGDFNGDGHDDLLLRNDNGWTTDWLGTASGGFTNNGAHFSAYIAPEWHVQDSSVALL